MCEEKSEIHEEKDCECECDCNYEESFWQTALPQILGVYFALTIVFFLIRGVAGDCVYRYMDWIFPVTRIHCAVK